MGNLGKKLLKKTEVKEEEEEKDEEHDEGKDDKKRNEVRKDFKLKFEKKIAKYIPPKIIFKGDVSKRSLLTKKVFAAKYGASHIILFKKYIVLTEESVLYFYNKIFKPIFSKNFLEDAEKEQEILSLNAIDNQTIVIVATDKVRIVNFYEKKPNQITYELIQEIKETEFYAINEKLSNGYLLLGGMDRKYAFYELKNKNSEFSSNNKYKLVSKIELVHNVYDDDFPGVEDLNNGRLFSWLNDDDNIKIIEYFPKQRIIKSMNGYGLHNAGLICDKYLLLMGLTYPIYKSWLMDTETLDIVKEWITPQNDSFNCSLGLNKFIYSSTFRIACDEFIVEKGEFIRKNLYETYFKEDKSEDWRNRFGVRLFLDENTFVGIDFDGIIKVFYCGKN